MTNFVSTRTLRARAQIGPVKPKIMATLFDSRALTLKVLAYVLTLENPERFRQKSRRGSVSGVSAEAGGFRGQPAAIEAPSIPRPRPCTERGWGSPRNQYFTPDGKPITKDEADCLSSASETADLP
jgi:hypothetical protein